MKLPHLTANAWWILDDEEEGRVVASVGGYPTDEAHEFCKEIVRRVNAFDGLLAACKAVNSRRDASGALTAETHEKVIQAIAAAEGKP